MPQLETIVVVCTDYNGLPAMPVYAVECTEQDREDGQDYEKAKRMAMKDRYAGPWICFDESEQGIIKNACKAL